MNRTIVHMDLDSFFVSVELLKHPELRGNPLIIGGSSDRGVVASCSYEARKFGVHAAMSSKMARIICPQAIFLRGDMESYSKHSRIITEMIAEKAPLYEKASIDEFYIDVSGMDRFLGCYKWTSELRQWIMKETGLPLSFGLSANKTVSKIATNESKPNGQLQVARGNEKQFLAPLPVGKIPMIGKKTVQLLKNIGVSKVETLSAMSPQVLENMFGKHGIYMWQRSNGIDHTPVVTHSNRKSMSSEETFQTDSNDVGMMKTLLNKMVEELGYSLRRQSFLTGCITVKIRYANFDTYTKQVSIPFSASDSTIAKVANEIFDKLYNKRLLVRLLGVRFSDLVKGSYQIDLFEDPKRTINLYQAMDKIRNKYGIQIIGRGIKTNNNSTPD
jgi:DNA polymerase-4